MYNIQKDELLDTHKKQKNSVYMYVYIPVACAVCPLVMCPSSFSIVSFLFSFIF